MLGDSFMKFYRLFYNLFAVASIAPILYLMISLPDQTLYRVPVPWNYLMLTGQGLSVFFLLVAVLQTDMLSFIGIRQLVEEEKKGSLVTNGLYRSVRHPLYTFSLLILWLSPAMSINSFIVYLALTIYRKLLREFGQVYAEYRSSTPMLLPGLKIGGNK
jgi:protein-S-isoprenylcysteine O-methyltransferase Ste14